MQGHAATPEDMEELGFIAANQVVSAASIALVGDLGAGKTHWTKGFVAGMGSLTAVTSPTFGLVHEYRGGRLPVFHFDFYRLKSSEELIALGWDDYLDQAGIIIVEWGSKFPELLPPDTRWLHFTHVADGSRAVKLA